MKITMPFILRLFLNKNIKKKFKKKKSRQIRSNLNVCESIEFFKNILDKASLMLIPERVNGEFKFSCVTFILI